MCIYMYMCTYTFFGKHLYTHLHTYIDISTYIYIHTYVYIWIYIQICICIHVSVCIYVYIHVYIYQYIHINVHCIRIFVEMQTLRSVFAMSGPSFGALGDHLDFGLAEQSTSVLAMPWGLKLPHTACAVSPADSASLGFSPVVSNAHSIL